jgi:hypothetical protein
LGRECAQSRDVLEYHFGLARKLDAEVHG